MTLTLRSAERPLDRTQGVHHPAEGHEPQRGRIQQRLEVAPHGLMQIDRERDDRYQHHHALHDRQRDQPAGHRPAHQMVAAHLPIQERERPEPEQRQAVRLDRLADDLGQEVVDGGQRERRVEQPQHAMPEPPVHGRLLDPEMHIGHLRHQVQHGKPEERAAHVPDRHIEMADPGRQQRQHQGDADQGAPHGKQDADLPGNLQPFEPVGQPDRDAAQAGNDAGIPHHRPQDREVSAHQRGFQHAGQDELRNAQAGHRRPAIGHRIQVDGADAPERQPRLRGKRIGEMQLERRGQPRQGGHQQPHHRTAQEHEDDQRR